MKIHSDILEMGDLWATLPAGCFLDVIQRGSRSRARAFDVGISAEHGADAHGIKRAYARNTGTRGAHDDFDRAATWVEWGDWMAQLFARDPAAKIGPYDGAAGFVAQTTRWASHRPERENATTHAARWARDLMGWRAEVRAALQGDSNDTEHDALVAVADAFGIDWTAPDA